MEIEKYLLRADSEVVSALEARRRDAGRKIASMVAEANRKGAYGGSAFRKTIRHACAAELRARIAITYATAIRSIAAVSPTRSDPVRVAAKDWIATHAAAESRDLEQFLWKPRQAFGEIGEPDTLVDDLRREQAAIFARTDGDFDRLQQNHAETWARKLVHVGQWLLKLIGAWRS